MCRGRLRRSCTKRRHYLRSLTGRFHISFPSIVSGTTVSHLMMMRPTVFVEIVRKLDHGSFRLKKRTKRVKKKMHSVFNTSQTRRRYRRSGVRTTVVVHTCSSSSGRVQTDRYHHSSTEGDTQPEILGNLGVYFGTPFWPHPLLLCIIMKENA